LEIVLDIDTHIGPAAIGVGRPESSRGARRNAQQEIRIIEAAKRPVESIASEVAIRVIADIGIVAAYIRAQLEVMASLCECNIVQILERLPRPEVVRILERIVKVV